MWKESVVAYFKDISWYLLLATEVNHVDPQETLCRGSDSKWVHTYRTEANLLGDVEKQMIVIWTNRMDREQYNKECMEGDKRYERHMEWKKHKIFQIIFDGSCISGNITGRKNSKHHHKNFKCHDGLASGICEGLMGDDDASCFPSKLKYEQPS